MLLEEAGLPYEIKPVNIGRGEQFAPAFLAISPNNHMPAIVDTDPGDDGKTLGLFESGALLEYLADKTGRFLPAAGRAAQSAKLLRSSSPTSSPRPASTALAEYSAVCSTWPGSTLGGITSS